jgi:Fur family ferric uptake transcriptional regulator
VREFFDSTKIIFVLLLHKRYRCDGLQLQLCIALPPIILIMKIIFNITGAMSMKEAGVFKEFLAEKRLKHSRPREWILEAFLHIEKHLTVEELWAAVRRRHPSVGFATVYRTLKLLCESGLCRELHFEDGTTRYEHLYGHEHHDHIICTECGRCLEVVDEGIEHLQERLMKRHGFLPRYHRMNLYGMCRECRKKHDGGSEAGERRAGGSGC